MIMRQTQRKLDNGEGWEDVRLQDLHKGDVFRMFEEAGVPVEHPPGITEFIAASEPYQSDARTLEGKMVEDVWTIEIVSNPGF